MELGILTLNIQLRYFMLHSREEAKKRHKRKIKMLRLGTRIMEERREVKNMCAIKIR